MVKKPHATNLKLLTFYEATNEITLLFPNLSLNGRLWPVSHPCFCTIQ